MGPGDIPTGHEMDSRPLAADRRLAVRYAAANALARSATVAEAAAELLHAVCEVTGWEAGLLWVESATGEGLERAGQWRGSGVESRRWLRLGRAVDLRRGDGLVGRVWASGDAEWLEHAGDDERYHSRGGRSPIASAVAVPIAHEGVRSGVLELVSATTQPLDRELLAGLVDIGGQLGGQLAFERVRQAGLRSEARMAAILDSALDAVIVMAADGSVLEFNRAAQETFGHLRADAVGRPLADLIIPAGLRSAHRRGLQRAVKGGGGRLLGRRVETTALRADGSEFPVELTITRVDLPGPVVFAATIRDISERHRAELELRLRERALAATSDAVLIADATHPDNMIVYVNEAFERITGYAASEVMGRSLELLDGPDTDPAARDAVRAAVAAGTERTVTMLHYRRDRSTFWDEVSIAPVRDEMGRLQSFVMTHRDISRRLEAERQIAHLAYHDAMTGLPNRVMFQEHLDLAIARARRHGTSVAVMFLDLDDFKLVNDSHGHAAGDRLLMEVGRRLQAITRGTDLVARQGGDEFLVLVPDLEGEAGDPAGPEVVCDTIARKIRAAVEPPILLAGSEVSVGVSLGVAILPTAADNRDELLRQADLAMYRAKVLGRGGSRHVYAHELTDSRSHLSTTARLRRAAERGDFVLHYQPIVELEGGRVVAAEALIRWPDGDRLVPPLEFIPQAERIGAIGAVSEWVVGEVCRQAGEWRRQGVQLPISFNMPVGLWRRETVERISEAAARHGVEPSDLIVEITESAMLAEPGGEAGLRRLGESGVRVAIDDFGTGYSSLARLRELPVDALKIDRSFVAEMLDDPAAEAIVASVVQLAGSIGLETIAEGIESGPQRSRLIERGCKLGQGFHFARPLPADELFALL